MIEFRTRVRNTDRYLSMPAGRRDKAVSVAGQTTPPAHTMFLFLRRDGPSVVGESGPHSRCCIPPG
jgi:hypothetical protein